MLIGWGAKVTRDFPRGSDEGCRSNRLRGFLRAWEYLVKSGYIIGEIALRTMLRFLRWLCARGMARAYNQAQKFGVEMVIPDQAHQLGERAAESGKRYFLTVGDDETLQACAVVVASGARYP